jgi:hypothetical protein
VSKVIHTCGAQFAPFTTGKGPSYIEIVVKRPRYKDDQTPPYSREFTNEWSCSFTSPYALMTNAGTLHFPFNCLPAELIALYPEDNKKPINTLRGKNSLLES